MQDQFIRYVTRGLKPISVTGNEGLNFSVDVSSKTGAPLSVHGPKEHGADFVRVVKALHAYGFARAKEAVAKEPFTDRHVRFPKR